MNSLRKTVGFLMVLMLAGFAFTSNAVFGANKTFTLDMAVAPPGTSPATVTAKFTNTGSSSFNSLSLDAPAGFEIIGTPTATRGQASLVSTGSGNRAKVVSINLPAGSGQFVTLTLTVKTTATCGATTGNWVGTPYEGSQLTGSTFGLVPPSTTSTTISVGCMSFLKNPANALVNTKITDSPYNTAGNSVQVSLTPAPVASTSVTLASSCTNGGLTLGASNSATTSSGVATFSSLASSTGGSVCTLTASATGYASASSTPFKVILPTLVFTNTPNNALAGVVITNTSFNTPQGKPVQVLLQIDGAAPPSGSSAVLVTMSSTCSGIGGNTASTGSDGTATFSALNIATAAQGCTLTANALSNAVSSAPSNSFGIAPFAPQAQVACGAQIPTTYTFPPLNPNLGPNDPGYVLVTRGQWNAKGETCALVPFQFSNNVLVDDTLIQKWDTSSQPSAAFLYMVNSKVKTGTPVFAPPKVAWEFDSSGNPINKLDSLKCLTSDLPKPYGRLTSQLAAGVTMYTLDRSDPQPVNGWKALPAPGVTFPLYLDTERMNAQVQSGLTLMLVRGQAGTTQTTAGVAHNPRGADTTNDATDDNLFLSTPLPVDPRPPGDGTGGTSPYSGKPAQMCWATYGLQAYDAGTGVDSYFQITDLFDFGDGFMDGG